jgi:glycine betaine/choline ABC-type transport system substrate-binding protein
MPRLVWAVLAMLLSLYISPACACVGKTLHLGIVDSPSDQLLAEIVSQLIMERTGTTVKVDVYKDSRQLYNAVRQGDVGLLIENTDRALEVTGKRREASAKGAYDVAKAEYRKSLNLVWLEPFGSAGGGSGQLYAPVISTEVMGSLPALPKLLMKLAGVTNDAAFGRLLKSAKGEDKPKKVARDFLKAKKLI